jgi:GT2 family glycosyltransferase
MKTVAVCIVSHNTRDLLRECLLSVLTEKADEIIVVDSASTDGSVAMLQEEFPSIPVIILDKNVGFGAASNQGIQHARSDHLILLNADTRMKPGSLQALNHYLEIHPQAALIGPRILNPDGTLQTSCFHFPTPLHIFLYVSELFRWIPRLPILRQRTLQKINRETAVAVPWILGAAVAFRREQIQQLGGFDERFFMYFEEVDLCYRLSSQGQQIHFVPEAEIIHVGGGSTTQKGSWPYVQFFASLAQFYRKHYSRALLTKMVLIVKVVALFKLIGSSLLMVATRDGLKQSVLKMNVEIQRNLLLGDWHQHADMRTVADAF